MTPSVSTSSVAPSALARLLKRLTALLPSGRTTVIGVPFIWLTLFFALPFVLVL